MVQETNCAPQAESPSTAPNNMEEAIAALAAVWVERWLAHGGWLTVEPGSDAVTIGMRMRSASWRSKNPFGHRLWHDGWKVGRWRELSEMAGYVPGLYEAITEHVASHGRVQLDGCRTIMRTAEEMGVV